MREKLMVIYRKMLNFFGPQGWWPGDTDFEVCVGAILTQNTSWQNVEKAIANIKREAEFSLERLIVMEETELARLIKPSGYFRLKAKRLKALLAFMASHNNGDWRMTLKKMPMEKARETLLGVYGIGPETADSILLYGMHRPSFVIDKYTLRFASRYRLLENGTDYSAAREFFMKNLPKSVKLYNEYHALLVALGKYYCKSKPACENCPLRKTCPHGKTPPLRKSDK